MSKSSATPAMVPTTIPAIAPPLSPPEVPPGLTAPVVVEEPSLVAVVAVALVVPLVTRHGALNPVVMVSPPLVTVVGSGSGWGPGPGPFATQLPSLAQYCQLAQQILPQAIQPDPSGGTQLPVPGGAVVAGMYESYVFVKVLVRVHVVVKRAQPPPAVDEHPAYSPYV